MNNESDTDFFDSITRFGMGTGIIGFVVFAMSYIFVTCLNHAAENQVTYNLIKYLILTFQKCEYMLQFTEKIFYFFIISGLQDTSSFSYFST